MIDLNFAEQDFAGLTPGLTPGWSGLRIPRACVVGLGLIGGSWAGALHQLGWQVSAVDSDAESLREGIRRGWIQDGWSALPDTLEVDLVVLASPLSELVKGFGPLAGKIPRGAIVTDVGSIKSEICGKWQAESFGEEVYFVGGHPMTGSEQSGFAVANQNLFRGYPYVLTPAEDCPEQVVEKLAELIRKVGADVEFRDPLLHDRDVALVSHIPHVLAVTLTLAAQDASGDGSDGISPDGDSPLALAGRSFRDLTRVAASSPEMWREIMVRNSQAILAGLELWQKKVEEFRSYLETGDGEKIAEEFKRANKVRAGL